MTDILKVAFLQFFWRKYNFAGKTLARNELGFFADEFFEAIFVCYFLVGQLIGAGINEFGGNVEGFFDTIAFDDLVDEFESENLNKRFLEVVDGRVVFVFDEIEIHYMRLFAPFDL